MISHKKYMGFEVIHQLYVSPIFDQMRRESGFTCGPKILWSDSSIPVMLV